MSVGLIVERLGDEIDLEEWLETVARHPDLRIRREPYVGINPRTGERIEAMPGEADAELFYDGEWIRLLSYSDDGMLEGDFFEGFDDPNNQQRLKIAQLARELGLVIRSDFDDEPLDW